MNKKCDVLLVFVNDNEKDAVYDVFMQNEGWKPDLDFSSANATYHDFGEVGGARVLGQQIEMGSVTRGGAAVAITDAINTKSPNYVILVGVAFGMDSGKHGIGDILVSRQLAQYEVAKIGKDDNQNMKKIQRGDVSLAREGILSKVKALSGKEFWQGAPVHFGLMVSGEKLINYEPFKAELREIYPEAIGGEMEAGGAYAAAELYKKDWIMVKAVCDYADGNKDENKDENQKTAAANAAQFVYHVLKKGKFGQTVTITRTGGNDKDQTTIPPGETIKQLVVENITRLLTAEKMAPLRNALKKRLKMENQDGLLVSRLTGMDLLDAVFELEMALTDCMQTIKEGKGDQNLINRLWDDCVGILGWLVLLGVNDDWARDVASAAAKNGIDPDLVLPVYSEAGVEIVFSRLRGTKADLDINEKSKDIVGKRRLPSCDNWGKIEEGWNRDDAVLSVKHLLWNRLVKPDTPLKGPFSEQMDKELNRTLLSRRKRGEPYYISINLSCNGHPLLDEAVYSQLMRDLPNLEIIKVLFGGQEVAIIGESELHAQLREFFQNKPAIRKTNEKN